MIEASSDACVEAETAARYVEHLLLPAERAEVERHIDGCAGCRELISAVVRTAWSQVAPTQDDPSARSARGAEDDLALEGVLPRGTRVGPFEIERPIDAGGMGLVYAAHDRRLDRRVALKCVRELRGAPDQLLREAKMMAQLSHPNVVPIYDVLEAHGQIFLAMELVVGRSVRQWLEAEPRSWRAVTDVFLAAGAGLAAAHAAGIVHSDVKPANILLGDDGRIRIADFGLSYLGADEVAHLGPRGTPAYMAPAQRAGQPCDEAGDQYAFCASLHEALFRSPPALPPASQPRLPRALRRIVARGLATEPAARFPSMTALLRALRQARSSRTRWLIGAVVVAGVLVALAYGVGRRRVQDALCAAAAPKLTSPWTAEARVAVRRSFHDARLSYAGATLDRVESNLDGWTRSFEAARRDACDRGWLEDAPPPARFSAQLSCLADRAREARALISQLRGVDATIAANAVAATEQLTALTSCAEPPPRAAVAASSPAREQLADQLALTKALNESGKFRDELPIARAAVTAAEAIGDPGLRATALVKLGGAQIGLSDYATASTTLMQAIGLAEAAEDDRARAKAWVLLMQSEYGRGHHDQVVFMKTPTLGAVERVGDVWLQTEALLFLGGALCELGRAAEAQPLFELAVTLRRQLYGDRDRRLAFALSSLGNGYAMQGNLAAGLVAHRQAVETAEAALGPAHPNVGVLHGNLGSDYLYGLQPAQAIVEIEKSRAIFEAANGAKQRKVAGALTDLGFALLEDGQRERALESFERAEAMWLEINAKHPIRAQALLGRFLASEALGRPTQMADLETALTLSAQLPPFDRGRIQLALGRVSTGARAAELVRAAIEGLGTSTLPLIQRELASARQWQHDHGAAP